MPGGFDEDPTQMGVAGFGDRAPDPIRAAGVFGGHEAHERHRARRGGKAAGVAEFSGTGERREVVDPAEAAQALDASA
jgi:hypothetical protein